jgi:hypothetical protein
MLQNITSGGVLRAFGMMLAIVLFFAALSAIAINTFGKPVIQDGAQTGVDKVKEIPVTPGAPTPTSTP